MVALMKLMIATGRWNTSSKFYLEPAFSALRSVIRLYLFFSFEFLWLIFTEWPGSPPVGKLADSCLSLSFSGKSLNTLGSY